MPTTTQANTSQTTQTQTTSGQGTTSDLDTLLTIGVKGAQIASAITAQRKSSGKSDLRQQRIAKCGRAPLFGRRRKEEYRKCTASLGTDTTMTEDGDVNKSNYTIDEDKGMSTTTKIAIVLGLVAVGFVAFKYFKK
jgi:hypothetical protein